MKISREEEREASHSRCIEEAQKAKGKQRRGGGEKRERRERTEEDIKEYDISAVLPLGWLVWNPPLVDKHGQDQGQVIEENKRKTQKLNTFTIGMVSCTILFTYR